MLQGGARGYGGSLSLKFSNLKPTKTNGNRVRFLDGYGLYILKGFVHLN